MAGNSNLHISRSAKTDEFYTQLSLIENELKHYKKHFENKVVFCNCDDPYESNFFKYFALNFNELKLKKLITTCYNGSPITGKEIGLFEEQGRDYKISGKKAYKFVMSELADINGDGRQDLEDVQEIIRHRIRYLKGDGDFRSEESVELLQEADIVVSNPPFSLFREYLDQLIKYQKKFLIIGNLNNVTYNEVIPLIMNNEVWLGKNAGHFWFKVPDYYEEKKTDFKIDENGQKWRRMGNICWYTNMDYSERHEDMVLYCNYDSKINPKYENFDAIEVSKTDEIPCDYFGVMGVPITFLTKYNPSQFRILGLDKQLTNDGNRGLVDGKRKYARLFIKNLRLTQEGAIDEN